MYTCHCPHLSYRQKDKLRGCILSTQVHRWLCRGEGGIDMDAKIMKLQELIDQHDNIVFFGGAGVSTESGIPDFR